VPADPVRHRKIGALPVVTRRLTLVPLAAAHADEMAAVLADPDLYAFTGGSPPAVHQLRARYERWIAGSSDPAESWCNWVIELRGQRCLAGTVQATVTTGDERVAPRAGARPVRAGSNLHRRPMGQAQGNDRPAPARRGLSR
jgi:RimJ/RimL family protein N-acetyltransferase